MRSRRLIVVVLCLFALPACGESFADKFFNVLKQTSANPDDIEMARYYVYSPDHASYVYAKVAAQDYPFIGILAAAKEARNKRIPGTSVTFDETTCSAPLTLFDAVFAKSSKFIDAYGKNQYVRGYLQAQNQQAKQSAGEQLAANLPYVDAIPHICDFTFHTNFQQEKQLDVVVGGVARNFSDAYFDLKSGKVVSGVAKLSSAGVSTSVACALVDDYVAGGFIAKTPVLSDLANGACAGFVGKVLGFASDAASTIMNGINDVGDWVSGQSKNMPNDQYYALYWRPRIPDGVAVARTPNALQALADSIFDPCVEYFDSHTMSEDNARETCTILEQQFVPEVFGRVENEDRDMPQWSRTFSGHWSGRCLDNACVAEVETLRENAVTQGRDLIEHRIDLTWIQIESSLAFFNQAANDAVARSKDRSAAVNKSITTKAASAWSQLEIGVWTPQCADAICVGEIKGLAALMQAQLSEAQSKHPEMSSLEVSKTVMPQFGKKFQAAITNSKHRQILKDPNAKAVDKLPLLGCSYFLGRSGQWLCTTRTGFDSCVGYVQRGGASTCLSPTGGRFADATTASQDLRKHGCQFQRKGTAYQLLCNAEGRALCSTYREGGMKINCSLAMPTRR